MPLLIPLHNMAARQLRFQFDWNISMAAMFRSKNENSMAEQFYRLAKGYADQMDALGISYGDILPDCPKLSTIPTDPRGVQ